MAYPLVVAQRQRLMWLMHRRMTRSNRERVYRPRGTIFGMHDDEVQRIYRFPPHIILEMVDDWDEELASPSGRPNALPPLTKVLAALHFFATGSFQLTSGIVAGVSQSSQSRALWQVVRCLLDRVHTHISMPDTQQEVTDTVRAFFTVAQFPGVIGAIDCTHIPLQPPRAQEHLYRNRHRWHSINVQVICDAGGVIRNVFASFPGSTHDSYIFARSRVVAQMEAGRYPGLWLIGKPSHTTHGPQPPPHTHSTTSTPQPPPPPSPPGQDRHADNTTTAGANHSLPPPTGDCGYPQRTYCMTPVRGPNTPAQVRYNRAHRRTRNVVERTFGILKSRFRCLDRTGGALLYAPNRVCKIVLACCVLHNVAVRRGLIVQVEEGLRPHPQPHHVRAPAGRDVGLVARTHLISTYFR